MTRKRSVAVIGAGISGLSCAQQLQSAGIRVRVFEKSSRPGGRCSTRLWQAHLVDHGTQYFCASTPEFRKELLTKLFHFRPIVAPVLDGHDLPVPSTAGPRFYALQGNNYLGHVLSRNLDVAYNTFVEEVTFPNESVCCQGEEFSALVCSAPGRQAQKILGLEVAPASFEPCLTALLEYEGLRVGSSLEAYARIAPEGDVCWSACENHKAGRVVGDKTVFVVHGSPHFSRIHLDDPPEVYLPLLQNAHEAIWKIDHDSLLASFGHLWRYSRAEQRETVTLPPQAFLCGDNRVTSEVEAVWHHGRSVAAQVLRHLEK